MSVHWENCARYQVCYLFYISLLTVSNLSDPDYSEKEWLQGQNTKVVVVALQLPFD